MKASLARHSLVIATIGGWALGWGGCATTTLEPMPVLPPEPPDLVRVPHPEGLDLGDLMAIFTEEGAPVLDSLKGCDADWRKLQELSKSKDELEQGTREFIQNDPVRFHWCFYGKLLELDQQVKDLGFIDERQKQVLDTYEFLTPVARAFIETFNDSRYLRWAIARYRRFSEFVFYRRLDLTPQMSAELGPMDGSFGFFRTPKEPVGSILKKYQLLKPAESQIEVKAVAGKDVQAEPVRAPAGEQTPKSPLTDVVPSSN